MARRWRSDQFLHLGALADSVSQVVQLRAADFTAAEDVNLDNVGGVQREGLFHADAVSHAADGEGFGDAAAVLADDGPLVHLDSFAGAFLDQVVNADGIAHVEDRHGLLQLLTLKSVEIPSSISQKAHWAFSEDVQVNVRKVSRSPKSETNIKASPEWE